MAAPSLTAKQTSRTIRQKIKKVEKVVLDTPFKVEWPVIDKIFAQEALAKLTSAFTPLGAARMQITSLKRKIWKSKRRKVEFQAEENLDSMEERLKSEIKLRNQLAVGVTAVTRGLEQDHLRLVIADRSAKPALLIDHLISLCGSRGCPTICVEKLSETVAPALAVTSLLAVGFKKLESDEEDVFFNVVNFIAKKAPPITLPWQPASASDEEMSSDEDAENLDTKSDPNIAEKVEAIIPLQTNTPSCGSDFSHLYLLRKDTQKDQPRFQGDHFIEFSKDSDTDESDDAETVSKFTELKKKRTLKRKHADSKIGKPKKQKKQKKDYQSLNIVRMGKNPNR